MKIKHGNEEDGAKQVSETTSAMKRFMVKMSKTEPKHNHIPPKLPVELWEKVCWSLDLTDIKSVRLAWRVWTDIGSRFLFKPFVFRADRFDFERFAAIMKDPALAAGIDAVTFDLSTMDTYWMANRLGHEYRYQYNNSHLHPPTEPLILREQLERMLEGAIAEYAEWNVDWHKSEQNFNSIPLLRGIFKQFKVLERIDITRKSIGFTNGLLLKAWLGGCRVSNFRKANAEFKTILLAIRGGASQLKHLSHDQVPVTFFAQDASILKELTRPLAHLRTLHLTFDASEEPHIIFWKGLGAFLCSIPSLENLRFGFTPLEDGTVQGGLWSGSDDPESWYIPMWKLLGAYTWANLKSLGMDGLVVCETGLFQFIERHALTIESLEFFEIGLWLGSFKSLLGRLRRILTLKRFHIWGVLRAFHDPNETWKLEPSYNVIPESWCHTFKEFYAESLDDGISSMPCCDCEGLGKMLEGFMLSDEVWPMEASDAVSFYLRPQSSVHSKKCEKDCISDKNYLDALWAMKVDDDLADWEDNAISEPGGESIMNGMELLEHYNVEGYDRYGLDRDGLNTQGVHHTDVPTEWQGAIDPISLETADRKVFRLIREKVVSLESSEDIIEARAICPEWRQENEQV